MSDVFYLSIYHCTSAHHQYSTCLITCAQSLYSIINFQLTLSAFITNSPVQIEMITSPSALKTLKQVRTMKQLFGLPYLPVIFQKFHQIKSIAITYSFEFVIIPRSSPRRNAGCQYFFLWLSSRRLDIQV